MMPEYPFYKKILILWLIKNIEVFKFSDYENIIITLYFK